MHRYQVWAPKSPTNFGEYPQEGRRSTFSFVCYEFLLSAPSQPRNLISQCSPAIWVVCSGMHITSNFLEPDFTWMIFLRIYRASDISRGRGAANFNWIAQSREIHQNTRNPAKFARNLTKYMSAQYIWKLSWLLRLLTYCKRANLPRK